MILIKKKRDDKKLSQLWNRLQARYLYGMNVLGIENKWTLKLRSAVFALQMREKYRGAK